MSARWRRFLSAHQESQYKSRAGSDADSLQWIAGYSGGYVAVAVACGVNDLIDRRADNFIRGWGVDGHGDLLVRQRLTARAISCRLPDQTSPLCLRALITCEPTCSSALVGAALPRIAPWAEE
jgi:hypothetical protein